MVGCVFCDIIKKKANVLYEDEKVFVMLAPDPATAGHVLVLPKEHAAILEQVPDLVVAELFKVANKVGVAIFEAFGAQGTNVLVQNGPAAGQKQNHVLLHVLARFENDGLQLTWTPKQASDDELAQAELLIKGETKSVGIFEKEKPKPIEEEKPKELKKEDYRLRRRVP